MFLGNYRTSYTACRGNAMTIIGQQMTIIDLNFEIRNPMQNQVVSGFGGSGRAATRRASQREARYR